MWQASDIYAEANQELLNEFSCSKIFGKETYLVCDTNEHNWYLDSQKHQMPKNGLVVVRDLSFENEEIFDDDDESQIVWDKNIVVPNPPKIISPSRIVSAGLFEFEVEVSNFPANNFLQYLKSLNLQTNSRLAYYFHQMWGGNTDIEYAWIFGDEDETLIFKEYNRSYKITESGQTIINEGVLQRVLNFLGLELPTGYFALHTGTFDWEKWRVRCDESNNPLTPTPG